MRRPLGLSSTRYLKQRPNLTQFVFPSSSAADWNTSCKQAAEDAGTATGVSGQATAQAADCPTPRCSRTAPGPCLGANSAARHSTQSLKRACDDAGCPEGAVRRAHHGAPQLVITALEAFHATSLRKAQKPLHRQQPGCQQLPGRFAGCAGAIGPAFGFSRLMGSGPSRRHRFVILLARKAAPSSAGLHREGTSMLVMKFSSRSLNSGMPTDTSKGEALQGAGVRL